MANFWKALILRSEGLKRLVASFLLVVSQVVAVTPGLAVFAPIVDYIAAFFGVGGLAHGAAKETITEFKLGSLAAFFAAILAIADNTPALQPYVWIIRILATIFGISNITATFASK